MGIFKSNRQEVLKAVYSVLNNKLVEPTTENIINSCTSIKDKAKLKEAFFYLVSESYIIDSSKNPEHHELSVKGISAFGTNLFYNQERKEFWANTKDVTLVSCNIAIAFAAILALSKDSNQISNDIRALKLQSDSMIMQINKLQSLSLINQSLKKDTINVSLINFNEPPNPKTK